MLWNAYTNTSIHTQYVFQFHAFFSIIYLNTSLHLNIYIYFTYCHKSKISQSVRRCGSQRSHFRLLAVDWIKQNGSKKEKKESLYVCLSQLEIEFELKPIWLLWKAAAAMVAACSTNLAVEWVNRFAIAQNFVGWCHRFFGDLCTWQFFFLRFLTCNRGTERESGRERMSVCKREIRTCMHTDILYDIWLLHNKPASM